MDIRKLQRAIVDGLEDVKAQHIAVFNTEHLSAMFERVIIASGTSNRQTKALAASVRDSVRSSGFPILSTEGEDNGEWIIVDCGAAVAHIMQPSIREYYHLEEIWGGKTVRVKVGEVSTKLVKASEPEPTLRKRAAAKAPVDAEPSSKAAAKPAAKRAAKRAAQTEADQKMANKSAAYNRVAAKGAAKTPAKTPAKAPAKAPLKSAAKSPTRAPTKAPAKKSTTKTIVVNPPTKAPAKSPARKTPRAVTTVARRTPARKAPGRG
jgi:ribosome-associated protein